MGFIYITGVALKHPLNVKLYYETLVQLSSSTIVKLDVVGEIRKRSCISNTLLSVQQSIRVHFSLQCFHFARSVKVSIFLLFHLAHPLMHIQGTLTLPT